MTLEARQRAMLREMGIRVWWPAPSKEPGQVPASPAGVEKAPAALPLRAGPPGSAQPPAAQAARNDGSRRPSGNAPAEAVLGPDAAVSSWLIEPVQVLYAGDGPRWLLLTEQSADPSHRLLLKAMLEAAGLHRGPAVWLGPLRRNSAPEPVQGLEEALRGSAPDLVFIMGRLAAQALLENSAPLGQLRGQVHELWGLPAVVSYDCAALLRHSPDKAKAWSDLCLAVHVAQQQYAERRESPEE